MHITTVKAQGLCIDSNAIAISTSAGYPRWSAVSGHVHHAETCSPSRPTNLLSDCQHPCSWCFCLRSILHVHEAEEQNTKEAACQARGCHASELLPFCGIMHLLKKLRLTDSCSHVSCMSCSCCFLIFKAPCLAFAHHLEIRPYLSSTCIARYMDIVHRATQRSNAKTTCRLAVRS